MKNKFLLIAFSLISISQINAQSIIDSLTKGHFTGSYENYSQYYLKDEKIDAVVPQDKLGSNNFLKLDYSYGKFSLGVQYESYMPSIQGYYEVPQNNSKIVNKYFRYTDKNFSVQVGDFYEQFGSGLILRSFENRQIGINNALEGANIFIQPTDFMKVKMLYGRTRKYFEYANSVTRGADVEFDIRKLLMPKNDNLSIALGGSYVGKYEEYTGPMDDYPTTANAYATRLSINSNAINFDVEFVQKNKDPHLLNAYSFDIGQALLINAGFTKNNFGININARALSNMSFKAERNTESATQLGLNYLPALTKQQDNLTSNIYVYNTQNRGESGLQADLFYNFKKGSSLGGKYGTKVAVNFAYYGGLGSTKAITSTGSDKYYRDINLEVKKKFNKKFEASLGVQNLYYNTSVIQTAGHDDVNATIIATGGIYKFAAHKSLKYKLERMFADKDKGNWMAATAEVSLSSPFSFYVSDLYNDGETNIHYYNVGASVTKNATRFSLNFGKQRAGLFCVGGVCRFVPAAYGFTATLTTSFGN